LSEAEAEALEDEYFGSPATLERVRGAEDDLIDDYAAGRLSPAEQQQLERRWAGSARQRERLLTARALRLAAGASPPAPASRAPRPARPGQRPGLVLLRLAALVVLSLGVFWTWRAEWPHPRTAPGPPPEEVRASPHPSPRASGKPPAIEPQEPRPVVLALSPLALRAGAGAPPLRLPTEARALRLELEGEPESLQAAGTAPLIVELATVEGRRVWTGRAARAARARPGLIATIELPAERLTPGDYVVSVSLARDAAVLERYFLRVQR
jgi:hypothetical protein